MVKEGGFLDRTLSALTGQKHDNAIKRGKLEGELEATKKVLADFENGLGGSTRSYTHLDDQARIDDLKRKIDILEDEKLRAYGEKALN